MIVRIMGEGQWRIGDDELASLNQLDDQVELAVAQDDQEALTTSLDALLTHVREVGQEVADDELVDSDLILPDSSVLIEEMREWLSDPESTGLIPD